MYQAFTSAIFSALPAQDVSQKSALRAAAKRTRHLPWRAVIGGAGLWPLSERSKVTLKFGGRSTRTNIAPAHMAMPICAALRNGF